MSLTLSPPATLTLRFTEWRCGPHGQRPADIPVPSPEQAALILQALSHAISQPGHAHAVLFDDMRAESAYITDDTVSVGWGGKAEFKPLHEWMYRPVVYFGTAAEVEELHSPGHAQAREWEADGLARWDGASHVAAYAEVTTTMGLTALEALARPVEWHEDGRRVELFELPPVFTPAADLLARLREATADAEAETAEIGGAA